MCMTDNEIIKALESLLDKMRAYEALQASIGKGVVEDIISMYDRQQAEIERLNAVSEICGDCHRQYAEKIEQAKSEAIKEFAEKVETALDERVSENIRNRNPHWYIAKRIVRETAIEMTEGKENE